MDLAVAAGPIELLLLPLGGLGEIGKNMTAVEYRGKIVVLDCGVEFPRDEMLGIDLIIPDIRWLLERQERPGSVRRKLVRAGEDACEVEYTLHSPIPV